MDGSLLLVLTFFVPTCFILHSPQPTSLPRSHLPRRWSSFLLGHAALPPASCSSRGQQTGSSWKSGVDVTKKTRQLEERFLTWMRKHLCLLGCGKHLHRSVHQSQRDLAFMELHPEVQPFPKEADRNVSLQDTTEEKTFEIIIKPSEDGQKMLVLLLPPSSSSYHLLISQQKNPQCFSDLYCIVPTEGGCWSLSQLS